MHQEHLHCPLCLNSDAEQVADHAHKDLIELKTGIDFYHEDKNRSYYHCRRCLLVFVPEEYHLTKEAEKAEYDLHENNPEDQRYRQFLSRLWHPLSDQLNPSDVGLDFGSGPGPLLYKMAEEKGFSMDNYDPFYAKDLKVFEITYDFITMTEVIEHIKKPKDVLERLDRCMKPKSVLAVMTKRVLSKERFINWHYKNDPTHICFYSVGTFEWIARNFNWQLEIITDDVVFLFKKQL